MCVFVCVCLYVFAGMPHAANILYTHTHMRWNTASSNLSEASLPLFFLPHLYACIHTPPLSFSVMHAPIRHTPTLSHSTRIHPRTHVQAPASCSSCRTHMLTRSHTQILTLSHTQHTLHTNILTVCVCARACVCACEYCSHSARATSTAPTRPRLKVRRDM